MNNSHPLRFEYQQLVQDVCRWLAEESFLVNTPPPPAILQSMTTSTVIHNQPIEQLFTRPIVSQKKVEMQKEPPPTQPPQKDNEFKELLTQAAPRWKLRQQLPNDDQAQEIAFGWASQVARTPIVILCDREKPAIDDMLERLRKGIENACGKTTLVQTQFWENAKLWKPFLEAPSLKLLLVSRETLETCPQLRDCQSCLPSGEIRLRNKPTIVVGTWQAFLSHPEAKRQLWRAITEGWKRLCSEANT